ncbi:hypothetical protein ACROYT_G019186 [Oculina patagonica]
MVLVPIGSQKWQGCDEIINNSGYLKPRQGHESDKFKPCQNSSKKRRAEDSHANDCNTQDSAMQFVFKAVLLVIVLVSAAQCQQKSNQRADHCLNHCSGVWHACMTSCDHHIHCMECTIGVAECREKCLPRSSRLRKKPFR